MKVWWKGRAEAWGNAKGYGVHNDQMLASCKRNGMEFVDRARFADVAFQIAVPTTYEHIPGKPNVLFTMYEMDSIPKTWIPIIQKADLLIVPCRHNKLLFQKYYDGPIEVCQEGIDPEVFKPVERKKPVGKEPFNFLWVGATNPRKGYELVTLAWELWIRNQPPEVVDRTQLYMKTQRSDKEGEIELIALAPPGMSKTNIRSRLIMDTRRVDTEELLSIYANSHAFLLPSFGEGWGLTLCEAQATGLPCVYTPWSGPVDFMSNRWSYPVRYRMVEQKTIIPRLGGTTEIDHIGHAAMADVNHIYARMTEIYWKYDTALRNGRLGATHLHRYFTWDIAGKKLIEILEKHYGEKAVGRATRKAA